MISDAGVQAIADLLASGFVRIFDASGRLLAELRFSDPAFTQVSNGSARSKPLLPDPDAKATGTASSFKAFASDGTTVVFDGSGGLAGADLILDDTHIEEHAIVEASFDLRAEAA